MSFLNNLSKVSDSIDVDTAVLAVQQNFQPINGEDKNDLIAKRATVYIMTQIVKSCARDVDSITEKLINHYYALGYLAGFTLRFIQSFEIQDKNIQTEIAKAVFNNLYTDLSSEIFEKTFDPQNADNHIFRKGTECGWQDVEAIVAKNVEPSGLWTFFQNEL